MIWSLLVDFKHANLRVFALTIHLITTGLLIWTKFDSLQVAMVDITDDAEFESLNTAYMTLLGFAMCFIIFQLGFFLSRSPGVLTLSSVAHLCLDLLAVFFNLWISLDGLSWFTYLSVWTICVLLPFLFDALLLCVLWSSQMWVTRRSLGLTERFYHWWHGKPAAVTD